MNHMNYFNSMSFEWESVNFAFETLYDIKKCLKYVTITLVSSKIKPKIFVYVTRMSRVCHYQTLNMILLTLF